ncbi:MAG TPA: hypothetical protein VGH81_02215 [Rudaea sp.]|jgi:hypothetical protein
MILRSLAPLLKLCAASFVALLIVDATLFRSGWYFRLVEPESTAGSMINDLRAIRNFYRPGQKNILVLGNSQVGEGFSAKIADAASGRGDLNFINGSDAGTTPRAWYYLLRAVDPDANRFAAIALMVDYDVTANRIDMTNYLLDTNYLLPLLRLSDLQDYPDSFTDAGERERARRAIVLPLQALGEDVRGLFANPGDRFHDLRRYRKIWLHAVDVYPGREERLPSLSIDTVSGAPVDFGPLDSSVRPRVEDYFRKLHEPAPVQTQAANVAYLREWLGRIARRYATRHIPVIVFVVPRGPWHHALAPVPVPTGAVAELAASGSIVPLPGDAFVDLEQPQYFFDTLHMNRDGRENFSRRLAQQLAPQVH